jgi:hypothetical protein
MPLVHLKTRNFPAGSGVANGEIDIDISWAELVWAAISVGRGSLAHIVQHGTYSLFEMIYRISMIYANLLEDSDGFFGRSSAYKGLDPSEKGAISYFMGLILTKAFVATSLNVPWLMHVDVYRQQFAVALNPAGGRPDLFGSDVAGNWVVAESKGRTNGHDDIALTKAKTQASQVISISGVVPSLSIGLVASFTNGRLTLVADDPPTTSGDKGTEWTVDRNQFRETYYRPFRSLFENLPTKEEVIFNRHIRTVRIESSDLVVGIDEARAEDAGVPGIGEFGEVVAGERAFLGKDGVYVRLGEAWEQQLMRQEPQTRSAV